MIFDRLGLIFRRANDPNSKKAAAARAVRWAAVAKSNPMLVEDIVHMGRVLAMAAMDPHDQLTATNLQLAYEKGRQDMAIDILAMMEITQTEFIQLMERDDVQR